MFLDREKHVCSFETPWCFRSFFEPTATDAVRWFQFHHRRSSFYCTVLRQINTMVMRSVVFYFFSDCEALYLGVWAVLLIDADAIEASVL